VGAERGQTVDVEALVEELRAEAAELRRSLEAPAGDDAGIGRLRELADPRGGPLRSHRPGLGGLVLAVKRGLIRLLTPIWDQQTAFDRAVVDRLVAIEAALLDRGARLERRLDDLDRRLAAAEDALARAPEAAPLAPGFDYERFEAAFRGSRAKVRTKQSRYLQLFPDASSGPVLDLGCGDGVFLGLLREAGVAARGVDRSEAAVARAREAGLEVREGDLLAELDASADGSLGGVVSFQVLEHLSLPAVLRLLRTARRKLRPGGVLVVETVNLASLIVFARAWTLDPTHRLPLHPLTLRFLADEAGFASSEIVYSGEVEPEARLEVPPGDGPDARNAARLNDVLFAPQDYAVIARA
jgi:O-antigen chain-terminating methyltransferase